MMFSCIQREILVNLHQRQTLGMQGVLNRESLCPKKLLFATFSGMFMRLSLPIFFTIFVHKVGERHGLVVSTEDYGAGGPWFESRQGQFFHLKICHSLKH